MHPMFTIGHSSHSPEAFLALLQKHAISALADVRSAPYSRHTPQFNYDAMPHLLKPGGIAYVFLGRELGPRREDSTLYDDDRISYTRLAQTVEFQEGLARLKKGAARHRIVLMCSEKDPIVCHRMILICHALKNSSLKIGHILEDGSLENLDAAEGRLMKHLKMAEATLFESREELIERAYRLQAEKIAFQREKEMSA